MTIWMKMLRDFGLDFLRGMTRPTLWHWGRLKKHFLINILTPQHWICAPSPPSLALICTQASFSESVSRLEKELDQSVLQHSSLLHRAGAVKRLFDWTNQPIVAVAYLILCIKIRCFFVSAQGSTPVHVKVFFWPLDLWKSFFDSWTCESHFWQRTNQSNSDYWPIHWPVAMCAFNIPH